MSRSINCAAVLSSSSDYEVMNEVLILGFQGIRLSEEMKHRELKKNKQTAAWQA